MKYKDKSPSICPVPCLWLPCLPDMPVTRSSEGSCLSLTCPAVTIPPTGWKEAERGPVGTT